jgi:hypothetical protein
VIVQWRGRLDHGWLAGGAGGGGVVGGRSRVRKKSSTRERNHRHARGIRCGKEECGSGSRPMVRDGRPI